MIAGADLADPQAVLDDRASTLAAVMKAVASAERTNTTPCAATIGISSNATVSLLELFVKRHALRDDVRVEIVQGDYDDVVGDVVRFLERGVDHLVLLPFFDNLLPAFEAQIGHLPQEVIEAKVAELRARYRRALEAAGSMKRVFLCGFHRMSPAVTGDRDLVDSVLDACNQALRDAAGEHPNVTWIDMQAVIAEVGADHAFDLRYHQRAKAPYAAVALNALARRIVSVSRSFGQRYHKALVVDCDNTLWGGIVGEDGLDGIRLDPFDHPGNAFWRAQNELVALERAGVLICLCSKNNPEDVESVLRDHESMVLRDEHVTARRVNWSDKAANITAMADELGIDVSSMVFLDDSSFECDAVRKQLPEVRTFQVPERLSDYPLVFREIKELFLAGGTSDESRSKTEQYRQRASTKAVEAEHATHEDFLASLGLRVTLTRDATASIARISELTLKSNQFNLTTRRYSESEVAALMADPHATVYSVGVRDRFGDSGLTGVVVILRSGAEATVEAFLLSCRILGRGVELALWAPIAEDLSRIGIAQVRAEYAPSAKNVQVADFFDRLGLQSTVGGSEVSTWYLGTPADIRPAPTPWIEIIDVQ